MSTFKNMRNQLNIIFRHRSIQKFPMLLVVAITMLLAQSCITDDGIPYPDIQAGFTRLDVKYQERASRIDSINRHITVYLNDSADITAVEVTGYALNRPDASLVNPDAFSGPLNLADTASIMLKVYREYLWTISAQQTINRLFRVAGQVGTADIDEESLTVTASVNPNVALDAVHVETIKLAGASARMTPDLTGQVVDFTSPVTVSVEEFGITKEWTIIVTKRELNIEISRVEPWSQVAWLTVAAAAGSDVAVEYRSLGSMQWERVDPSSIEADGGEYLVAIHGLQPETTYEVCALLGEDATMPMEFTTGSAPQLLNSSFTNWWLDNKVWCPWVEGESSFWETGNKGAATLGQSNVMPIVDESSPTGFAGAHLETRFIGVSILGKLGAGSIFTGRYVKTDGTNGILAFGRPFTERPTRVRATIGYQNVAIDYASSDFPEMKGRPDTCVVWCALSDRAETYEIRTNPKSRQLFDPEDPSVIAYGIFQSGDPIAANTVIEFKLDYRSLYKVPQQIIMVCAASKYGDFFTGGAGSTLEVKSVELLYD